MFDYIINEYVVLKQITVNKSNILFYRGSIKVK